MTMALPWPVRDRAIALRLVFGPASKIRQQGRRAPALLRPGAETTWRPLMPRIRHHVYYWRDEAAGITTILLVANAIAETGPDL